MFSNNKTHVSNICTKHSLSLLNLSTKIYRKKYKAYYLGKWVFFFSYVAYYYYYYFFISFFIFLKDMFLLTFSVSVFVNLKVIVAELC